MTQVPLAPPPPTGGPIDGWLFLLWKRLTATGQLLWSSIVPGSSADVAAVVTDETGSPGSLVFSGNPTLEGVTVDGLLYQGDTTAPTGPILLGGMFSTNTAAGAGVIVRKSISEAGRTASVNLLRSRGTNASPESLVDGDAISNSVNFGFDGTNYSLSSFWIANVDGVVSAGIVPGSQAIHTVNAAGAPVEAFGISSSQVVTLGGSTTAPALKVTPVASQARWIEVTGATSSGNPTIGVSGGILAISTSVAITGVVSTSGYTVATLPAGTVGQRAYVTDALAPAYGVAVAGGGAVTVPVFYDGAAWICA